MQTKLLPVFSLHFSMLGLKYLEYYFMVYMCVVYIRSRTNLKFSLQAHQFKKSIAKCAVASFQHQLFVLLAHV